MKEALFYEKLEDKKVRCVLCPHNCMITEGDVGICKVRRNVEGKLISEAYGELVTISMDPIEKKPLFHFYPGTTILSIGFNGCNFGCRYCQNWRIAMEKVPTTTVTPQELVDITNRQNSNGIAFTYTEPVIGYEYIIDTAKIAKEDGVKIVLVTNGFINPEPLKKLLPYVDAMNIDLKSMDPNFYRKLCKGQLEPVLETIKIAHQNGVWVEITYLVITAMNDRDQDIEKMVDFVAGVDKFIPVHLSRYFPAFKFKLSPTPIPTLRKAYEQAKGKLHYVYLGNVSMEGCENTFCPECGNTLIKRNLYTINVVGIEDHKCNRCGREVDIEGV